MRTLVTGVCVCALLMAGGLASPGFAGSRVAVESRSMVINTSAAVGIYIENAEALRKINIPLVIRAGENAAYPTYIRGRYNYSARIEGYLEEIKFLNGYDNEDGTCKQNQPGGFGTITYPGPGADMTTITTPSDPDALLFNRTAIVGPHLPPGTDFPIGSVPPSIIIDVTVAATLGTFEIDTTCVNPASHILIARFDGQPSTPLVFDKGLITVIDCVCAFQGDLNQDGERTNTDLALLIDLLFVGVHQGTPELSCPAGSNDLDCDGFPTAMDLGYLVDHLFAGGPEPCNPCVCASYPDNCP